MRGPLLLAATTVAFHGATLIDGTGAPPVPDALLVVSEGRVVSAGAASPAALAALPPGAEIVDLAGAFLVPGLVDAHVHADSDAELAAMLGWGVTSVRLMAEDSAAANATAKRAAAAGSRMPDVFPAAPIFTTRGGWWDEGHPPDSRLDRFPATPAAARASVRAAGGAEIKLMWDDMAWCRSPRPVLARIDPEVAAALIGEAAALGMRAIVHAPRLADARAAVRAGATGLAHGVLERLDDPTIAVMKARPVTYVPTLDIFEFLADPKGFAASVLSDPRAAGGLPEATVAALRSPDTDRLYAERYPNREAIRRALPALRENVVRLHRAGVPVALGTDMWAFPGLSVSVEADLYVRAGLSPGEALRAATAVAARSVGAADRGTLEPGRRADFLVLAEDPLRDVRNLRAIRRVYKAGEPVSSGPGTRASGADAR